MSEGSLAIGRRHLLQLAPGGYAFGQVRRPPSAHSVTITDLKVHLPAGLVRVIAKERELEGWCLDVSAEEASAIARHLRPLLVGRDPLAHERIWLDIRNLRRQYGLRSNLFATVDAALWDLCGKIYGLPVFQVIGGFRKTLPAYVTGAVSADKAAVVREAIRAKEQGCAGYKVRYQGEIAELAGALRRDVGPGFVLMHSGEQRYTAEEALRTGRILEKSNFYWFEEPLAYATLLGLKALSRDLDVPVAAAATSMEAAAQMLASQSVDVLRTRPLQHGGVTEMLKMARAAEAFGVSLEFSPRSTMEQLITLHLQASVRNSEFFESRSIEASSLLKNSIRIERGQAIVPVEPGLGLALDWQELERQTTRLV